MLKLIYITGYGRSGSTILDILLGQHDDIFGMGELSTMTRHVWANDEYCACGVPIRSCSFWPAVMQDWHSGDLDPEHYLAMQKRIEPLVSPWRRSGGASLVPYLSQTERLLENVADRAGTSALVDSSKLPGRGLALAMSDRIDLRAIHLVRDGRAVAHSMSRAKGVDVAKGLQKEVKSRSAYRTALRWRMYNTAAEALARRVGAARSLRVRYEDLMADPESQLERISACIDVDLSDIGRQISAGAPVCPAHQMAGSRIRMKGPQVLKADNKWEHEISDRNRRRVARAAGGQLIRYGYGHNT